MKHIIVNGLREVSQGRLSIFEKLKRGEISPAQAREMSGPLNKKLHALTVQLKQASTSKARASKARRQPKGKAVSKTAKSPRRKKTA